ncbi:asparagine synthase (glutamine-hydrolyzing) [Lentisphaerota bacterium WC36G]|nr:asparagine synthase (glutamine-hydrolyzing) [Lentisphaerae bacterium WC36]
MCGIHFTKNVSRKKFKKSLDLLYHRGPNASDVKQFDNIFLGHTRLAIIDLDKRSSQPFTGSDNETHIIFNGEIYNFKELKKQFNIKTRTSSDTEILLELYLKLGEDVVNHLNGMFAFVIYNSRTKDIFIARDRLGIKPLYIYEKNDTLIISSEIASILESLEFVPEYDLIGIRQYLKLRTFFRGHTLYKDIKMFPAGYYRKNDQLVQYWNLENHYSTDYNDEKVKELIESSIEYRLISDVETGSYLSGGIDSSLIAVLAQKEYTWTTGFNDFNEFEYARIVAERYKFNHQEVITSRDEFKDVAKFMIEKRKEPLSVPNEVSIFEMTQAVAKHNTVVLSGEGADELFFGYDRIFRWAQNNEFDLESFDKLYSYGTHKDDEIIQYVLEPVAHIKDNLLKISTFFQLYHLHGLLRRLDNATMLCSVEARVPFVDHRLIEYMYGIGCEYKMKNGIVKEPLKRIFSDVLPSEIINRKKVGFPIPIHDIFHNKDCSMDGWLHFNIETILKDDWTKITEQLKTEDIYV